MMIVAKTFRHLQMSRDQHSAILAKAMSVTQRHALTTCSKPILLTSAKLHVLSQEASPLAQTAEHQQLSATAYAQAAADRSPSTTGFTTES